MKLLIKKIVEHRALDADEKLILLLILLRSGGRSGVELSNPYFAEALQLSLPRTSTKLASLIERGLIRVMKNNGRTRSLKVVDKFLRPT